MAQKSTFLALAFTLMTAGCNDSHQRADASVDGATDCTGASPSCFPADSCCSAGATGVASCVGGTWTCTAGQSLDCYPDPCVMDGDAGARDAGIDAGPVAECTSPTQCVVVPASCCGSCGAATADDMIAVAQDAQSSYRMSVCGETGCPACFRQQDPSLFATCQEGSCLALDMRTSPLSTCSSDADCELIAADCCGCEAAFIAINHANEAEYRSMVCNPVADCPPCGPQTPPDGTSAICDTSVGHCAVFQGG